MWHFSRLNRWICQASHEQLYSRELKVIEDAALLKQPWLDGSKNLLPSGKRLHNYGKIHHAIHGKTENYFDWAIFNSKL